VATERVSLLKKQRSTAGLFLDFDGTLSEIVHVPSEARPVEGVAEALAGLARSYGLVSVVSGRSAHELIEWLGAEIEIWGVHGAERSLGGSVTLSDAAAPFAELMAIVREEAEVMVAGLGLDGVIIEDKTVMIGLHFRAAEDQARARIELDRVAEELSAKHGLVRAGGRLAYELRPPMELTKAAVVLERSRELGLTAAAFVGDDTVDLPGFDALDLLAGEGVVTVRVAVRSDEAPPELLERADVIVDGPPGTLDWLQTLL
jgi:trehalose 6-phosphate phosphatase